MKIEKLPTIQSTEHPFSVYRQQGPLFTAEVQDVKYRLDRNMAGLFFPL
jgi:hypothetical protein